MNYKLQLWQEKQLKKNHKKMNFSCGDVVRVYIKTFEGEKQKIQQFEGTVIRKRGEGLNQTFTVRKISFGIGVERTFPFHSPIIEKIKVIKKGKTRRAKLYYLREKIGKETKVKEAKETVEETAESTITQS
jgi:large subunit ribosomal protein L19